MTTISELMKNSPRSTQITLTKQEIDRLAKKEMRELQIQNYQIIADVPKRFKRATLEVGDWMSLEQGKVYCVLQKYCSNFKLCLQKSNGLILIGNIGTGKSYAASAIANTILLDGFSVKYITANYFFNEIKSTFKKQVNRTDQQIIDTYSKFNLLIIDEVDIGCGSQSELSTFEKHSLFTIINKRYERLLPTIVTSNAKISELPKKIGERSFDRLRENAAVLGFSWNTLRRS